MDETRNESLLLTPAALAAVVATVSTFSLWYSSRMSKPTSKEEQVSPTTEVLNKDIREDEDQKDEDDRYRNSISRSPTTPAITIMYWPFLGRASGLFRMLAEAGVEYEHVTDGQTMAYALAGDETTNLAPPIVLDHENRAQVSQAVACHSYIGNKYGFNEGIDINEMALQRVLDLDDFHTELLNRANADRKAKNVSQLQQYITSDRYKNHLQAIDRSIQGPFYFGDTPTYVDFAVCSYLDMCTGKWLNPLEPKAGDTLKMYAPKLKAIYRYISSLPSASKVNHLPLVPPGIYISSKRVATWKQER